MSGGDSGEKAGSRPGWSGVWFFLAAPLLVLALLLREPGHFINPQFWAEDGTSFFMQAWEDGFARSVFSPLSGYLHTFPRLTAGLALLFPLKAAPLVFNLAAFAAQALPILYLLGGRLARHLPNRGVRVLAAALYVAVPNSYETYVNLTNSQWSLGFAALLILLADRPVNRWVQGGELALLALFALTGPFCIVLLPCAALNLYERRRDAAKGWWIAQTAVLAAGAAVQVATLLGSQRPSPGAGPDHSLTLQQVLQILSTHVFYDSVLGINHMLDARWAENLAAQLLGLALTVLLIVFVALQRHRALLWLLYLATVTITLSFLFPLNDLKQWLNPGFAPRYYLYATFFVLYATMLLCVRGGRLRWLGVLLALPVLAVGIPGDHFYRARPDTQWADQAAVFATLPQGASMYVPIQPNGLGGITMRKKAPGRDPSPLDGLRRIPGNPPHGFGVPSINWSTSPPRLNLSGWVANGFEVGTISRVWLIVDGRPFPAVVERVMVRPAGEDTAQGAPGTGFNREIPLSDLRPGFHSISLVLLTRDGSGYSQTSERQFSLAVNGRHVVASKVI